MQSVKTRMICLLLTVLYICLWSNLSLFATSGILNTLRNLYTCVQYGILCPINNLNIRIKTEPVTVGADPTVQCKCMSGFCTVLVSVLVRITLPLLFRLSLVRFFLRRFRFIWVSAQKKIPHEATDMNTMFSGPVCHMWPTERKYIFCAMPQGRWRHFLPHHYSEPIIHRVVRPLLSLMKPLRHSAHLKNKNSTLSLEPHRKNAHLMWLTKKIKKLNAKVANFALKGQCQEIFGTLF